ncbi:bifunctional diaminohydroxyphosphoribosylaminopyrimidine deaminase/5-amino-6-(5-phosphoribosylamino)uracil reductase RibD [Candidatus Dependentiae bacterium]|nr:bifunctional diaminohydroxyphosphoribosylaminopyrimidine deaminase/5-amino-6-(5-phosphoribosylamino)uracil reductase RibD [Candidatus Dependentiae bacterium]
MFNNIYNDEKFMRIALKEAEKGKGLTYPNPAVGAIIVNKGKILSSGWHKKSGNPHAEVEAIKSLNFKIPPNSELYVTLEPCSHFGKTPPCANLIVKHNFKRVVIGILDPNPLVNGKGKKILEQAGIKVSTGIRQEECYKINEDFFYAIKNKLPFITVKCALTLDGKIASLTGDSKWISNEKSRTFSHYLRKINSAIMVGANTVKTDNPSLDIRLYKNKYKQNTNIIVIDPNFETLENSNILKNNPPEKIFVVINKSDKKIQKQKLFLSKKINLLKFEIDKNGMFDINNIMKKLYSIGINSIIVEGGGTLIHSLFKSNLVNKIHFIYAPKILGFGIQCVNGFLSEKINDSIKINNCSVRKFNEDFMITGYPEFNIKE